MYTIVVTFCRSDLLGVPFWKLRRFAFVSWKCFPFGGILRSLLKYAVCLCSISGTPSVKFVETD